MKKCLIIYDSYHHGNTEKVAKAMAAASGAGLCRADEVKAADLAQYELVGFGSGIAFGKHYDKLLEAAGRLELSGKEVFVFSTSGAGKDEQNAELIGQLKSAGAAVAGSFACKGFDTYGPFKLIGGIAKGHPDGGELEAAKRFIEGIAESGNTGEAR
ncbi:MAG TPA: flavodoxin family protein [Candidatus Acidoferrum sp.]|nr:flavodoxin family protein [Candidatus Acidoferrum sp.]